MRARVRALGHPVHPMLVVLPLGLFVAAVVFDLIHLISGNEVFGQVGYWNTAAAIVGALLAGATGVADWTKIPDETRAKRVGLLHGAANTVVLLLFALVFVLRSNNPEHTIPAGLFAVEVLALAIGGGAAWLGGELVDRLGIGVDDDAHPDAPSSLRPAARPSR